MDPLFIKGTSGTPEIDFLESDSTVMKISGRSIPEDADLYYGFVISWLNRYVEALDKEVPEKLKFKFYFHYYNTSSYRYMSKIMTILENIKKLVPNFKVYWYYDERDEDMLEMGEDFEEEHELGIKLIEVKLPKK